ncbi:gelsolin-related protein of 125 kDa-like [Scylla paramamosain]|uniref:gelsolin-related protein of 125 kDa-like n=1 Tax=Scylla paramamosain TaxID=85552 RepID=UPI003082E551
MIHTSLEESLPVLTLLRESARCTQTVMEEHVMEEHLKEEHLMEEHLEEKHLKEEHLKEEPVMEEHLKEETVMEEHIKEKHFKEEHFKEEHNMRSKNIYSKKQEVEKHLMEEQNVKDHMMEEQKDEGHVMKEQKVKEPLMEEQEVIEYLDKEQEVKEHLMEEQEIEEHLMEEAVLEEPVKEQPVRDKSMAAQPAVEEPDDSDSDFLDDDVADDSGSKQSSWEECPRLACQGKAPSFRARPENNSMSLATAPPSAAPLHHTRAAAVGRKAPPAPSMQLRCRRPSSRYLEPKAVKTWAQEVDEAEGERPGRVRPADKLPSLHARARPGSDGDPLVTKATAAPATCGGTSGYEAAKGPPQGGTPANNGVRAEGCGTVTSVPGETWLTLSAELKKLVVSRH